MSAAAASASPKVAAPQPRLILCVDDEPRILHSLHRVFRDFTAKILLANGGREALDILAAQPVDLVISDMRMPEMTGAELLTRVAEQWPQTVRILLTGHSDMECTVAAINDAAIYRYLSKPWDETDLRLTVTRALEQKAMAENETRMKALAEQRNVQLNSLNTSLEDQVAARTEALELAVNDLRSVNDKLRKTYRETIEVFFGLIKIRDQQSAEHAQRVAALSQETATGLKLSGKEIEDITLGALMHDVGDLGLPAETRDTPHNALTRDQFADMSRHAAMGEAVLMSLEPLENVAKIIGAHHELFDGTGFPNALKGSDIPLGGRIVSLANEYDGLINGSHFGEEYSHEDALTYVQQHAGSRYDPALIEAFVAAANKQTTDKKAVIQIATAELKPGMVLAQDIANDNGLVLVRRDQKLSESLINKLQKFAGDARARFEISVYQ